MPMRPKVFRPVGVPRGRAPDTRLSRTHRGYDEPWQRLRRAVLMRRPLCQDCESEGIMREANELHHKRKISDRPDLRLDESNLLALCKPCHSRRTAKGE